MLVREAHTVQLDGAHAEASTRLSLAHFCRVKGDCLAGGRRDQERILCRARGSKAELIVVFAPDHALPLSHGPAAPYPALNRHVNDIVNDIEVPNNVIEWIYVYCAQG